MSLDGIDYISNSNSNSNIDNDKSLYNNGGTIVVDLPNNTDVNNVQHNNVNVNNNNSYSYNFNNIQHNHSIISDDNVSNNDTIQEHNNSINNDATSSNNNTSCLPAKRKRSYCSFVNLFVSAALLQLIVAIVIWFLGYQTSRETVNSLATSYRSEFMSHAVDKTTNVFETPINAIGSLDFMFQRHIKDLGYSLNNVADNGWIMTYMSDILNQSLPDMTAVGFYVLATNTTLIIQDHMNDSYPLFSYEFNDNTTAPLSLEYHYSSGVFTQPYNYSRAAIVNARSLYQAEPFQIVKPFDAPSRPWIRSTNNKPVGHNYWSNPYVIQGQAGLQGVVIALSRAGSFNSGDSGTVADYVVMTTIRMYPVVTSLLQSIPAGANGHTYLLSIDLYVLALTNSSNIANPVNTTIDDMNPQQYPALSRAAPYIHNFRNSLNFNNIAQTGTYQTKLDIQGQDSHLQIAVVTPDNSLYLILVIITQDDEFDGGLSVHIVKTAVLTAMLCVITIIVIALMVLCLNRPVTRIVRFMSDLANDTSHTNDDDTYALKPRLQQLHEKWCDTINEPLLIGRDTSNTKSYQQQCNNNNYRINDNEISNINHGNDNINNGMSTLPTATNLPIQHDNNKHNHSTKAKLQNVLHSVTKTIRPVTRKLQINELRILGDTFEHMLLKLIESQDSVDLANQHKTQFMRFVFHEVRVPLNAITLGVEQLKDTKGLSSDVMDVIEILSAQVSAVTRILNDVLSIQRIEENRLQLEFIQFCLDKFVIQTVYSFMAEFNKKQLNVKVSLNNIIYDICVNGQKVKLNNNNNDIVGTYVLGDQYRLRQVFANFISNSCKFVGNNGNITINVTQTLNNNPPIDILRKNTNVDSFDEYNEFNDIRIGVNDNGPGIAQNEIRLLFQPYRQINAAELQQGKGSGLGLSIAKRLIALHGGQIGCNSIQHVNTEFYFTVCLPVIPHVYDITSDTHTMSHIVDIDDINDIENDIVLNNNNNTRQLELLPDIDLRHLSNRSDTTQHSRSSHTSVNIVGNNRHTSTGSNNSNAYVPLLDNRKITSYNTNINNNSNNNNNNNAASNSIISALTKIIPTGSYSSNNNTINTSIQQPQTPATTNAFNNIQWNRDSFDANNNNIRHSNSINNNISITPLSPQHNPPSLHNTPTHTCNNNNNNNNMCSPTVTFTADPKLAPITKPRSSTIISSPTTASALNTSLSNNSISGNTTTVTSKPYRILVVEDSAPNRKLLVNMLKRMSKDYVVDSVENGQLCVDLFKPFNSLRTASDNSNISLLAVINDNNNIIGNSSIINDAPLMDNNTVQQVFNNDNNNTIHNNDYSDSNSNTSSTFNSRAVGSMSHSWPFDLILMDGQMPLKNGFDATRELRDLGVSIPIVAVTGNALNEDQILFRQAGVNDIITKPIQLDVMKRTIKHFSSKIQ